LAQLPYTQYTSDKLMCNGDQLLGRDFSRISQPQCVRSTSLTEIVTWFSSTQQIKSNQIYLSVAEKIAHSIKVYI